MRFITGILVLNYYLLRSLCASLGCDEAHLGRLGSGVLQSPNFPFNYPHNETCRYRLYLDHLAASTRTVCFRFQRFDLEASTPFCSFDWLRFGNIKYCSRGLWQYGVPTQATESNVWFDNFCWEVHEPYFEIVFSSDNNINASGFYATYTVQSNPSHGLSPPVHLEGQAPCTSNQFTCFNRRCVARNLTCDGTDHCGDGSDEAYAYARCGAQNLLACDFSSSGTVSDGFCGLSQEGGEWFRMDAQVSPYGPVGDHTSPGTGHYVYMDGTRNPAYLVNPEITLPSSTTYCMTFFYYLYGTQPGASLDVYIQRHQLYSRPEWSRVLADIRHDAWQRGQILLTTSSPLQVVFGAQLTNTLSGVALDDVSILPGQCHGADHSCQFESSLCGWQSVGQLSGFLADLTWRRHSRHLGPVGPLHDRSSTDGSGSYLLVNANSSPLADPRGLLVSPPYLVYPGVPRCLHFSYQLSGQGADCCLLRVYLLDSRGVLGPALWAKRGQIRGQWREALVTIEVDTAYQVVLEGAVEPSQQGVIALDGIHMEQGECPGVQEEDPACMSDEYLCADGGCIPLENKCDWVPQCADGSDEDWRAACPTTTTTTPATPCPPDHFRCLADSQCIASNWVCDNFDDCSDNSDESVELCVESPVGDPSTPAPCGTSEFSCDNGACVPRVVVCDDVDDCGDNSDENTNNCTWAIKLSCGPSQVPCVAGGFCMPETLICDGHVHCPDGFDESPELAGCVQTVALGGSIIGTAGAIGIGLACLLLLLIVALNILLLNRRKKRRQEQQTNTSSATLAGDISTISYGEEVTRTYLEDEDNDGEEGHIYETLVEPPGDFPMGPPPYTPRTLHNIAYIPEGINLGPPPTPPPLNRRPNFHTPHENEPPPPYEHIIKDTLTLHSSHLPATRWLQPSTAV